METIDSERVKCAVYNRIDYDLPEEVWKEIDEAFGVCWNEVIGFGNEVDRTEVINYVADRLRKRKVMILESRLTRILDIMFDYIKMVGGFIDESKPFLPKRVTHRSGEVREEKSPENSERRSKRCRIRTLLRIACDINENWDLVEAQPFLQELLRPVEGKRLFECQESRIHIVCAAACLAKELHKGQVDKAGKDYFEGHLLTVGCNGRDWKEQVVGFLHDVLEDTDYTSDEIMLALSRILLRWDVLPTESEWVEIKEALELLNSHTAPNREAYIERFRGHRLAISVKLNDLRHNMDISRIPHPSEEDLKRVKRYGGEYESLQKMLAETVFPNSSNK